MTRSAILVMSGVGALIGIFLLLGVSTLSHFAGIRDTNSKAAPRLARAVFSLAKSGQFSEISEALLATSRVASDLRVREEQFGQVRTATIDKLTVRWLGLPVYVELLVTRDKGPAIEVLTMNSMQGFDSVTFENPKPVARGGN